MSNYGRGLNISYSQRHFILGEVAETRRPAISPTNGVLGRGWGWKWSGGDGGSWRVVHHAVLLGRSGWSVCWGGYGEARGVGHRASALPLDSQNEPASRVTAPDQENLALLLPPPQNSVLSFWVHTGLTRCCSCTKAACKHRHTVWQQVWGLVG